MSKTNSTTNMLLFIVGQTLLATPAQSQDQSQDVEIAWTRHYAQETTRSRDVPKAMLVDRYGNLYVLGNVTNLIYGHSLLLLKFDQSGQELWRVEYTDGPGEEAEPVAMGMDDAENIYALGHGTQQGSMTGIVLIKYDEAGNQIAFLRYDDASYSTNAVALAIAPDGSAYVSGNIDTDDSAPNILTLKYDPSGQLIWVDQYNGTANLADEARSIVLGPNEMVYTTGTSETTDRAVNHVVTRRLSSNGDRSWEMIHETTGDNDGATALSVDKNGYAYVLIRNQTYSEIIKYDSLGTIQWIQQTHPPSTTASFASSFLLDKDSSIYLAGVDNTRPDPDYFVEKFDSAGTLRWSKTYDGGESDEASSVVVDTVGNVYITGRALTASPTDVEDLKNRFITIKYDSSGNLKWLQSIKGPDELGLGFLNDYTHSLVLAPERLIVMGTMYRQFNRKNDEDIALLNYALADGEQQWNVFFNGAGRTESEIKYIASDGSDNIFLAGDQLMEDYGTSFVAAKYNSEGMIEWEAHYRASAGVSNFLRAMTVDGDGNVYLGGVRSTGFLENRTLDLVKLDKDGHQQWDYTRDFSTNRTIHTVTVADDGTVCFSTDDPIYSLISLSASGLVNWVNSLSRPHAIRDIVFDGAGGVYAIGDNPNERIVFVRKYDRNGDFIWQSTIEDAALFNQKSIATLHDDYLYVTCTGLDLSVSYTTAKYRLTGEQVWLVRHVLPRGGAAKGLVVDQAGNVFVAGWRNTPEDRRWDYLTVKHDSNGQEQWARACQGIAAKDDELTDIGIDSHGNVFITGESFGTVSPTQVSLDYVTIAYSSEGDTLWSHRYNSRGNEYDRPVGLVIDSRGDVIVSGNTERIVYTPTSAFTENAVATTIKYKTPNISSVGARRTPIASALLHPNYPNPFNPTTRISFSVPKPDRVQLTIYNLSGQRVRTLFDGLSPAGQHSVEWDGKDDGGKAAASGIYFYKLESGGFTEVKRMLLIR